MEIGYLIPMAIKDGKTGEIEIQIWEINWIAERTVQRTRKSDNICFLCGKEIPIGSCCKSANIVVVPSSENKCPREMFPIWWHDGCERLSLDARIETVSTWAMKINNGDTK